MPIAPDRLSLTLLALDAARRHGERGPVVAVIVDEDAPPFWGPTHGARAEAIDRPNLLLAGEGCAVAVVPLADARLLMQGEGAAVEAELGLPEVPGWLRVVEVGRDGARVEWVETAEARAAK